MNSIDRSQQVVAPQTPVQLEELQQAERVSRGFDQQNSSSHTTGGGLQQLPPAGSEPPSIPAPDYAVTGDVGNLKQQVVMQTAANLRGQVEGLSNTLPPELQTEQTQAKLDAISEKLSRLEDASPEVLHSISNSLGSLAEASRNGTLTSDKLDEILMQINGKMEDNSTKYAQETIKIQSQDRQMQHESNIEKIRDHIEEVNEAKKKKKSGPFGGGFGLMGMKLGIGLIFPPLALYEASLDLGSAYSGKNLSHLSPMSMLHTAMINDGSKAVEDPSYFVPPVRVQLRQQQGKDEWIQSVTIPERTDNNNSTNTDTSTTASSDPVFDASEGLGIAQTGMSNVEMMKLLMQMKQQDESNEKLAEAIAALEAGDPSLAAEILSSSSDTLGMQSGLDESLTASTDQQQAPTLGEQSSASTAPDINLGAPSDDEGYASDSSEQDFDQFLSQLSQVPEQAAKTESEALLQMGQIQRGTAV